MKLSGPRQSEDLRCLSLGPEDRFLVQYAMASVKEALVSEWLKGHGGTVCVSVVADVFRVNRCDS